MNNKKIKQFLALPIGIVTLVAAVIIDKFFPENRTTDFVSGFLLGLSVVLNMYYIIVTAKKLGRGNTKK